MAWAAGGMSYAAWAGFIGTGTPALTYGTAANQYLALYSNAVTPNYHDILANECYAATSPATVGWLAANEITGTNWPAGGVVMTTGGATTSVTDTGTVLKYTSSAALSVASCTFTGAYGGIIYMNTLTPKCLLIAIPFPAAPFSPTAGTFSITWNASGIFTLSIG
jgi:hypothetical protein